MRRIMCSAAAAVILLGGCTGSDTPAPAAPAENLGNDGVVEPSAPASLPSGIVFTQRNYSTRQTLLTVYDITTGEALAGVELPDDARFLRPEGFDPPMSRMAYVADCELRLAVLAGGQYTETARWAPPQAFGEGEQCFRDPAFGDDGLIRAAVGQSAEPGRMMAVDPATPATAPKDEGAEEQRKEKVYRITGPADAAAYLQQAGTRISSVSVSGEKPGGNILDSFRYTCPQQVDTARRLCIAEGSKQRQYFGSVALLTLDPPAATATMKQVAPQSEGRVNHVAIAPDGRKLAIKDSTGWYTTTLDGAAAPVRQPLSDMGELGDVLFWH